MFRITHKELGGRYYQLLSGHTVTVNHLVYVRQAQSDRCWDCSSRERQTRHRLLIRCKRWVPKIRRLWQRVEIDCEWLAPRAR